MAPAAAISQNQKGSEMSVGAADLLLELEDELELELEEEEEPPEELDEPVDVGEEELEEVGLVGVPVELIDDSTDAELEGVGMDVDEPEEEVAVAATRAAAAAAFTAASVDVTFISKLVTSNVTLLVACQVSDPNWMRPRNASLSIKLFFVR